MNGTEEAPEKASFGQTAVNGTEEAPEKASVKAIVIGGPTASGKSEIALQIAQEFGGAVINADSMQVYQELKIVTARPDDAAMQAVPHMLYGVLPTVERCSAGRWCKMADSARSSASRAGQLPIFVGGTGLYLKALTDGLANMPDIPTETVAGVTAWLEKTGLEIGRHRLWKSDPETASRLAVIDRQRLLRALSVLEHTGKPLSWWTSRPPIADRRLFDTFRIAVLPPRETLYPKINDRFARMVDHGALEEIRHLASLKLDPSLPAMKAVGVPQLLAHLAGDLDIATAVERGQTATRQYAKRQFTWFTRQFRSPERKFAQFSESIRDELFKKIRQFLLTP